MDKINYVVAKNLSELRRKNKLTQSELAEILNYSDKAVSKWEQGSSLPGIEILYKLSKLYNVSLDYIVGESTETPKRIVNEKIKKKRILITMLSILAVWVVATVLYIAFDITMSKKIWMVFSWAVPASMVVSIVFDVVWLNRKLLFVFISLLLWSLLLCFCIQFIHSNIWIILAVGIPLQAATVIWAFLVK